MNMFSRFDEHPAMTLKDIKETRRYVTDGRTHTRTDNVKTVYPPQTKFAGGYKNSIPTTNKVCGGYNYRLMQVKSIAECSKRAFCNTLDLH